METGTLKIKTKKVKSKKNTKEVKLKKSIEFFYTSSEGGYRKIPFEKVDQDQISPALQKIIEESASDELKVDFEVDGDRIVRLREHGQAWVQESGIATERIRPEEQPKRVNGQSFHNPYNFVPALPRDQVTGELGDRAPVGHGRYLPDCWTGRIAVKLTTVTPLLIPDASKMTEDRNGHKTFPVRIGADDKPYLPPTSIKGMLRSAYEAVTNSRLSILESHDSRLAYRMPANMGLQMVPAQVVGNKIRLYPGTSEIGKNGRPTAEMYAAWLPRYDRGSSNLRFEVRYPDGSLPEHGDHVKFWAEKFSKINRKGDAIFSYWKVREIVRFNDILDDNPPEPSNTFGSHQPVGDRMQEFEGFVYITNKNIDNKHDERIFIVNSSTVSLSLTNSLKQKWQELLTDYQAIHKDEIRKGVEGPPALNHAEWSRQVITGDDEKSLPSGTLCYAHVKREKGDCEILDLYPVMITRGLYEAAPIEFLDNTELHPSENNKSLSPAERVFGWVNQKGKGSYKGHLRCHSVACISDDPLDDFGGKDIAFPWLTDKT